MTANKVLGCQCHHTALGKMKSSVLGRYKCKAWTCRSLPCCGCSLFADLQEGGQGSGRRSAAAASVLLRRRRGSPAAPGALWDWAGSPVRGRRRRARRRSRQTARRRSPDPVALGWEGPAGRAGEPCLFGSRLTRRVTSWTRASD